MSIDTKRSAYTRNDIHYPARAASAAAATTFDIYLFGRDQAPAVAEVKARKGGAGFTTIEGWLAEFDALFLRRNHADPLVVLSWRTWARLLERGGGDDGP